MATATAVGEVLAVLGGDGPLVAWQWQGPYRDDYDRELDRLIRSGVELESSLSPWRGMLRPGW